MSEVTHKHLVMFWELIDEVLNAVLFLLIGFEILVISFTVNLALLVLLIIPVVLLGPHAGRHPAHPPHPGAGAARSRRDRSPC